MTEERRRFYRIDDHAFVDFRVIDADALSDERRCVFLNEVKPANMHAAITGIDLRLPDLLGAVRSESKPMAEALELINRKLTLLERVITFENARASANGTGGNRLTKISLSGGGMALAANNTYAIGTYVALELTLLPAHHFARIIARVVDCRQTDPGKTELSIEFEEMRDEDREFLIQHVLRLQSAALRAERQPSTA